MSTVKVDNIQKTGESVSRDVSGVAAAWCHYHGNTATVVESSNVASSVDLGTGQYQINLTSNMTSSTYVVNNFISGGDDRRVAGCRFDRQLAASWNIQCRSSVPADSNAFVDEDKTMGSIHGDLA